MAESVLEPLSDFTVSKLLDKEKRPFLGRFYYWK